MRTLYLALDVNPRAASGDGVHVREVTSALSRLGARITLVMPSTGKDPPVLQSEWEEVRIVQIDVTRDVTTVLECARLARSTRAELIYERRFSPKIGVAVSFLTRLPLVVEVNGLVDAEAQELASVRRRAWFLSAIRPILRKVLYSRPTRVVAVTPGIARELRSRHGFRTSACVRYRTVRTSTDSDQWTELRPANRWEFRNTDPWSVSSGRSTPGRGSAN